MLAFYETFEYAFCYDDEKKEHRRRMKLALRAQKMARDNSNSSISSNSGANENTRLIPNECIPMQTLNRPSSSEGAVGGASGPGGAVGGASGPGATDDTAEALNTIQNPDIPNEILETLSPDEIRLNMSLGDKLVESLGNKIKEKTSKNKAKNKASSEPDPETYTSIK